MDNWSSIDAETGVMVETALKNKKTIAKDTTSKQTLLRLSIDILSLAATNVVEVHR
ncbi:MAG: hypothetical protein RTV41_13490 [Candidatus Thorarchaeota archaeon]